MKEPKQKRRQKNVAHVWEEKKVLRFLRKSFDKKQYKQLRSIYVALCEIDSDFSEVKHRKEVHIKNLSKTCATYAGTSIRHANKAMQILRDIGLIDYGHMRGNDSEKIIGSYLVLYCFDSVKASYRNSSLKENPHVKNVIGYKNNTKDKSLVLSINKNSSLREENTSLSFLRKERSPRKDFYIPRNVLELTKTLLEKQQKKFPNFLKEKDLPGRIEKSAAVVYNLQRLDKHSFNQLVKPALEWAIEDEFWETQLFSFATLRNKSKRNEETKFHNIMAGYLKKNKKITQQAKKPYRHIEHI